MAVVAYAVSVVITFVILHLWGVGSIAVSGMTTQEVYALGDIYGQGDWITVGAGVLALLTVFIPVLDFIVTRIVWGVFRKMGAANSKKAPRISVFTPIMPGLFLVWSIVFYALGLARANDTVSRYNGLLRVGPTAAGWLYVMCCIALAGLVVFQAVICAKSRKD